VTPLDARSEHDFSATWARMVQGEDPSGLRSERNVLRFRPLPRGVLLRVDESTPELALELALGAAAATGTRVELALAASRPRLEDDEALAARLAHGGYDVLRLLCPVADVVRRACAESGVRVDDDPVTAYGECELAHWSREQSVSWTLHRYGSVPSGNRPASGKL
jgi:RHH-type proline utilization regulon transcriptional repressor/proline dehydrogenase/delta 1-pyrroline-5-carboxylate dehydrogenase